MKKRPLTLMEVLIALGLMSILIGALFSTYARFSKLERNLDLAKTTVLKRKQFQERLLQLTSKISHHLPDLPEDGIIFYVDDENRLHFFFDNGIDRDSYFSHTLEAILELKNEELLLTTSPPAKPHFKRKEILFTDIESLSFDLSEELGHFRILVDDITYPFFLTLNESEGIDLP